MPDKHVLLRLKRDHVIWLATVGRDNHPHAVPVWFWWDGKSFLIYSVPGQKVEDIRGNPNVNLHLNTDDEGEDVVRIEGRATIRRREPPADRARGYIRKYTTSIKGFGWTNRFFAEKYHVPIRVRPLQFH